MGKKKSRQENRSIMNQHCPKSTRFTLRNSPSSEPVIASMSACLAYQPFWDLGYRGDLLNMAWFNYPTLSSFVQAPVQEEHVKVTGFACCQGMPRCSCQAMLGPPPGRSPLWGLAWGTKAWIRHRPKPGNGRWSKLDLWELNLFSVTRAMTLLWLPTRLCTSQACLGSPPTLRRFGVMEAMGVGWKTLLHTAALIKGLKSTEGPSQMAVFEHTQAHPTLLLSPRGRGVFQPCWEPTSSVMGEGRLLCQKTPCQHTS